MTILSSILLLSFMLLMVVSPLLVWYLEKHGYESLARMTAYVDYTWMGFAFLFFASSIAVDGYRLILYLQEASHPDPERTGRVEGADRKTREIEISKGSSMRLSRLSTLSRTYRHMGRYRQILSVLFKYGFEGVVDRLDVAQYLEIGLQMVSRKRRARLESLSRAERVRMALEELGPTFVKLGQVLSTRPDLVPMDFVDELPKLQDSVPAFLFAEARDIVEE